MPSIRDELASYGLLPIVYDYVRMGVRRDYVLEVPAEDEAAVDFLRQVCDDMDGDELFGRILQFSPIIAGRIEAAEKRPVPPKEVCAYLKSFWPFKRADSEFTVLGYTIGAHGIWVDLREVGGPRTWVEQWGEEGPQVVSCEAAGGSRCNPGSADSVSNV